LAQSNFDLMKFFGEVHRGGGAEARTF